MSIARVQLVTSQCSGDTRYSATSHYPLIYYAEQYVSLVGKNVTGIFVFLVQRTIIILRDILIVSLHRIDVRQAFFDTVKNIIKYYHAKILLKLG